MTPTLSPLCSLAQRGRVLFCVSIACYLLGDVPVAMSQNTAKQDSVKTAASVPADKPRPPAQLESLVAPIALYPDPLLAQTLVASTYPLEIVQLHQWMAKNPTLKDKALADAVAKEPWDPSIQSMAALPDVVKRLADDIQWTTELGNAFLAQQAEVMDAVQRMRKKAKDNGKLASNEQQKVETKVVEQKTVIVVEPSNPEVIYVPSYSPTVVYGSAGYYPYPPIYYPPYPYGAAAISFGIGMMWGAAIWGGSCCNAGWGGGSININNNNNFNRVSHYSGDRGGAGGRGSGNWSHNPQHRGGAPYADSRTNSKFGGQNQRAGVSDRSAGIGQGQRGAGVSDRSAGAGQGQRGAGVSDRAAGGAGQGQRAGVSDRAGGGAGVSDRASGAGAGRSSGGDRIGNQSISRDAGSRNNSAFGGGYNGSSARASSSRGSSSMGSRGGMSRGGGGGRRR